MRTELVFLALAACASTPPPPPPRAPLPPADPYAGMRAAMAEQEAARIRADAEMRAHVATMAAQADAAARTADESRRAREEAATKECETSRADRAADAQRYARAELEYAKRVAPVLGTIRARCKLTLATTGKVNVQRSGGGLQVSPEQREGVTCAGGVPKGATESDVWVYLSRTQPGAVDSSGEPVASDSQLAAKNMQCRASDLAAGLDTQVARKDAEGVKKLLAWSPTSAAP